MNDLLVRIMPSESTLCDRQRLPFLEAVRLYTVNRGDLIFNGMCHHPFKLICACAAEVKMAPTVKAHLFSLHKIVFFVCLFHYTGEISQENIAKISVSAIT